MFTTKRVINAGCKSHSGFTLIEIMLVVIIIGMLLTVVMVNIQGTSKKAKISTARTAIDGDFKVMLNEYEMENGRYPTTEQGLKALCEKPIVEPIPQSWRQYSDKKVLPKDPWGNEYVYKFPGDHDSDRYDLSSKGPDQLEGTEDDVCSWKDK